MSFYVNQTVLTYMQQKIDISHFTITGDSLTDRGEMSHRKLFGIIPMDRLSGLWGKSPLHRFTNRFTWADHFIGFVIDNFKKMKKIQSSEADEIAADDKLIKGHYFDNYQYIEYAGHQDFVRCYAEGGLSSHDYSWMPSKSISRFFSRLILTNLDEMRERLFDWDYDHKVSKKQKAQTLAIEWSGANDFVTLNEKPSELEARKAVKARIKNVKKLIKHGYCHFVLFNVPDLSLTPQFQDPKMADERPNATRCTDIFNQELEKARLDLEKTYPHCSIDIFDVNKLFKEAFDDPAAHGFNEKKKTLSYCDSPDFQPIADDEAAGEYMFWNKLHPSDKMHSLLAKRFQQEFENKYNFVSPETIDKQEPEALLNISSEQLLESFQKKYEEKVHKDAGCFGFFRRSNIKYKEANLECILKHALYEGGDRTREVIRDLQWINKKGELNLNVQALKDALTNITTPEKKSVSFSAT